MQETGQSHSVGESSCPGFLRAADAMLPDRPEGLHMAVPSAYQGQCVRDIFNKNALWVRIHWLEMLSRVGCDVAAHF